MTKSDFDFIHEGEFKRLTETIPQAVWRTNLDGSADYFSQRFYELVGYEADDVLGWGWFDIIHPEDQPGVKEEWQRCRDLGAPVSWEFRIRRSDGNYRWFLSMGSPLHSSTGEIIRYYGTWTDIHDKVASRQQLEKLTKDLQEAVFARDEFISIASHELKTPLTALKLQSQILKRYIEKNDPTVYTKEKVDHLVDQTDRHVTRLTRLVDDMLDMSRIRTGRLSVFVEELDLSELIRETLTRIEPVILEVGAGYPAVNIPETIMGTWDRLRIEQVLTNICINALRYGRGKPFEIAASVDQGLVTLMIKDQGTGIPKQFHEKIFERFERAVEKNEVSGLGLGLYITKQIILTHKGRIWVESEVDLGSTFFIEIPIHHGD